MNEKYLEEARQIEARWKKTGLLDPIVDRCRSAAVAVLLENQRKMNENPVDTSDISQFKRINIPLVRRLYKPLVRDSLMGVVPMPVGAVEEFVPRKEKPQLRSIDDQWDS